MKTLFKAYHRERKQMYWFDLMWGNYLIGSGYIGMVEWGKTRETLYKYNGNQELIDPTNCDILQCTGLKSADGGCGLPIQDLFFGDIIIFYNTDGKERLAEIIWHEEELCIGFKRLSDGFVYTQRNFNDNGYFQPSKIQFQIIGNIYENQSPLK